MATQPQTPTEALAEIAKLAKNATFNSMNTNATLSEIIAKCQPFLPRETKRYRVNGNPHSTWENFGLHDGDIIETVHEMGGQFFRELPAPPTWQEVTDEMVQRFLSWQLPKSVVCDPCCGMSNYEHPRSGTCIMNGENAKAMLEHVLNLPH